MNRRKRIEWTASLMALAMAGCGNTDTVMEVAGTSQLALTTAVGVDSPVESVTIVIQQVDCDDGTPTTMAPIESVVTNAQFAPAGEASNVSSPDADHLYADWNLTVPAGCYGVTATPDEASGCFAAQQTLVPVAGGGQIDLALVVQCAGVDPGVLDTLAITNHEPEFALGLDPEGEPLQAFWYADENGAPTENGGIVHCDEQQTICARARDLDGDPVQFEWSFSNPSAENVAHSVVSSSEPTDGWVIECVSVANVPAGQVDYTIAVYDLLADGTRIEDALNGAGQTSGATESRTEVSAHYYSDRADCLNGQPLSVGDWHTCAIDSGGGVKCWGSGGLGDGGLDPTVAQSEPVDVLGLPTQAVSVSAGANHSCALLDNGEVYCWGRNYEGQLGLGFSSPSEALPVLVANLPGEVVQLSTGGNHTCARYSDGAIACWGENGGGQLGDGGTTNSVLPIPVVGLAGSATDLSLGGDHSCAVLEDGTAACWGANPYGELGDGTTNPSAVPLPVAGVSGVLNIAAGFSHTCARLDQGGVACWGDDLYGQAGDGPGTGSQNGAVDVVGLAGEAVQLSANGWSNCVLLDTGAAQCWGEDAYEQLGSGPGTNTQYQPVDVVGLVGTVVSIHAGRRHGCAITDTGAVQCWGDDEGGQLGDGAAVSSSSTPVPVLNLP